MEVQRTLSIIKPDAVRKNLIGRILARFEEQGLRIIALRMLCLSKEKAQEFYGVHRERPFFNELVEYITSGPVVVSVLEGVDAIALNRKIMGVTDPKKAAPGTIRKDYGESIGVNAVHGSDSIENAAVEVRFFFPELA